MKRQSKAEEALQKQVRILKVKEEELDVRIAHLQTERESHRTIRIQLEDEIHKLEKARIASSERNKPKA
jgi:hypothetical protein